MSSRPMRRLAAGCLVAGLTLLSACTPEQLNALLGPSGSMPAGRTGQGSTPAAKPASNPASDPLFAAFKVKVEAAAADPERTAKLFVAAFAHYKKDATLAKEMMTLAADAGELSEDPASRSGFRFITARDIYWTTVDRQPELGLAYLTSAAALDGPNPEDSVTIDHAYNAMDKGVNGDRAKFFIALQDGSGKRPRPVSLKRTDGKWRVSDFGSLMVTI